MPSIGVITFELRTDDAQSLKDKRHYVKGLKDRLRTKFNVAVAEIDAQDSWQRGLRYAVFGSEIRRAVAAGRRARSRVVIGRDSGGRDHGVPGVE
ncbi:MAG TPA: DUF503 domain-containing protein [Bryobacteraceae bacterium]|nr:DUF503 domain-containing protein [Bryobacteraceae bacterium]